jgi:F0F1-type ATP synthase assembly protein I
MADTTWRMFVPTIGLLMVGRKLDTSLQTKPWCMLTGAALGGVIAWLLIKKQVTMKRNI